MEQALSLTCSPTDPSPANRRGRGLPQFRGDDALMPVAKQEG